MGVARYSKLYGSFALVPIVLFWVFVSWEIVLFGAEVAFAIQNCTTYRLEYDAKKANIRSRLILALSVIVSVARAMKGKAESFETAAFARDHRIPVRFLNDVIDELVRLGLLASVSDEEGRYVMIKTPDDVTVRNVIDGIMGSGVQPEALGLMNIEPEIERIIKTNADGIGGSLSAKTIAELA